MATKELKIEKSVPLPPRDSISRERKKQIHSMLVGDSFLLDECATTGDSLVIAYCTAMREMGMRASCRVVEGGVRVWRIAHDSPVVRIASDLPVAP